MLGERCETGLFFKILENSFKVINCDQAIEISALLAICVFKRSNTIR